MLHLWCNECCTCAICTKCRTCARFHHTSYIRNMYATCVYATSTTPHIRNMYATCVYATSTTPHIIRNMYATCVYATSTTPHIYATCMLLVCMLLPPHLIYTQHVCYLCVCYFHHTSYYTQHVCYLCTQHALLVCMQTTSIPHMCILHSVYCYSAAYMLFSILCVVIHTPHTCSCS